MEKDNNNIKAMSTYKAKVIAIVFLCFLIYPVIDQAFKITKRRHTDQVKKTVKFPSLDTNKLDSLPKLLENYYNDKFSLQDFLVEVHSYFKIKCLGVSPDPTKAIVGKNG